MALSADQLKSLARIGAAERLQELDAERRALLETFPNLKSSPTVKGNTSSPRGRRRMSAKERRAVSQRMKKYWAARKASKTHVGVRPAAKQPKTKRSV